MCRFYRLPTKILYKDIVGFCLLCFGVDVVLFLDLVFSKTNKNNNKQIIN